MNGMDTHMPTCFALEVDTCTAVDNEGNIQIQTLTICNVKSFRSKCLTCGEIFPPDLSVFLHMQTHRGADPNIVTSTTEPRRCVPGSMATPTGVDQYTMTAEETVPPEPSEHYVVFEASGNVPVTMNEALEDTLEDLPSDEENSAPKPRRSSSRGSAGQTTPQRKYQCDHCELSFPTRTKLKIHMRKHTGEKPFPCPICEKPFTTRGELTVHSRTHTGIRPYQCPKCDLTQKTRSGLHCHMARHHQEKAYTCEVCDRKFAVKHYFTAHLRTHNETNPHKCAKCGKSFAYQCYLKKHEGRNICSEIPDPDQDDVKTPKRPVKKRSRKQKTPKGEAAESEVEGGAKIGPDSTGSAETQESTTPTATCEADNHVNLEPETDVESGEQQPEKQKLTISNEGGEIFELTVFAPVMTLPNIANMDGQQT